jgi:HD-GYP domain-containing protein (c-di-GMP phosphodiesterase class II)
MDNSWTANTSGTNAFELYDNPVLNFSQVLSSLSYALDLTSGYSMGHAQRSCLIGMRIAAEIGLSTALKTDLYFALLLKDSGCSSNAARMYEIFGGDDIASKSLSRVTDWDKLAEVVKYVANVSLPKHSLLARARKMLNVAVHGEGTTNELSHTRCSRGAQIALSLGMGAESAACISALEERWDGAGSPYHLKHTEIPLLSRIASLSQNIEVFFQTFDLATAYEIVGKRSGRWFDPELVKVALSFQDDDKFWSTVRENPAEALKQVDCEAVFHQATESRINAVCDAFASIVDAKSPFTGQHSTRVCQYSMEIAAAQGLSGTRLTTLRRASLLHDIGKLGVSNAILDKPSKLNPDEWIAVKRHPYYSAKILGGIDGFSRIAHIAAAHHERLDGKGYFQGLTGDQMDLDMRIVAVADVFDALHARRPYRDALPYEEVFRILDRDSGTALDSSCIDSLKLMYAPQPAVCAPLLPLAA